MIELGELGARIQALRRDRGLTLQELAGAAAVSASMLSSVERGRKAPTIVVLARIADGLGVPLERADRPRRQPGHRPPGRAAGRDRRARRVAPRDPHPGGPRGQLRVDPHHPAARCRPGPVPRLCPRLARVRPGRIGDVRLTIGPQDVTAARGRLGLLPSGHRAPLRQPGRRAVRLLRGRADHAAPGEPPGPRAGGGLPALARAAQALALCLLRRWRAGPGRPRPGPRGRPARRHPARRRVRAARSSARPAGRTP